MVIRRSQEEDLPRLKELTRMGWEGSGGAYFLEKKYGQIGNKPWLNWKFSSIEECFKQCPDWILVTEIEGKIAGYICYRIDKVKRIGTIGNNTVDPAYRGKGIGTKQVEKVIEIFKKEGMLYAEVTVALNEGHKPARKLYDKFGFEPIMDSSYRFRKL